MNEPKILENEILDDLDRQNALDPQEMYQSIYDLPEQIAEAEKIGEGWDISTDDFVDIKNIVVVGMGGSAIGGDFMRCLLRNSLHYPFEVVREYSLPEYVDDETLVIVSSYSGNTEETLSAVKDAIERKAMLAALTTGGELEALAKKEEITHAMLPKGFQPRAAVGLSTIPLYKFLEKVGLAKDTSTQITETILSLKDTREKLAREISLSENPAKKIAAHLCGKLPLVYSGPDLMSAVAVRWRCQISENSKSLAYSSQFPEMNHNELVGWTDPPDDLKSKLHAILLRDPEDNPRVKLRMDKFKTRLKRLGVSSNDISASPGVALARMFEMIQFGDFVSYYLAVANSVDPTPVDAIEELKAELAKA